MVEITLKDGRAFNCNCQSKEYAIGKIKDYLFCEYNDTINNEDIITIEIIKK